LPYRRLRQLHGHRQLELRVPGLRIRHADDLGSIALHGKAAPDIDDRADLDIVFTE